MTDSSETALHGTMSISDVAARTGLSTHTLRYYEREGLMFSPVDRASSTHRRYSEDDVNWVVFLTKLRLDLDAHRQDARVRRLARRGDDDVRPTGSNSCSSTG